ncbi:SusD/RagB family nutrient-binding outer membrane lipoprotein [Carboxylicivirga sediminis]|uniref:SusD/RagB family nutrient-binding outer membrane lipoprotein n=1 Tax=Carboxylicivirga sediminis TaxID=2006564 RepID=A0A941F4L1_9BACT|nr:SusD/RagB family nutrient-binding outer membrane lipoprotein [Carboxylicivirga sediminis]MBR8536676.1 SusD/RagB family nutrient-binding outer membrane lipoprotein [Carboxylicivirga sediminis]
MRTIYIILILSSYLILGACDDRLEKINTNPNAKNTIDPEYLFSNAVLYTNGGLAYIGFEWPFGLQYGHYYVGNNIPRFIDNYYDNYTETFYSDPFNYFFKEPIRHIKEVIRMTRKGGDYENPVRYSLAKVVESYNYIRVADAYGAVPYTQGGYGQEEILYPAYDQVEDIYKTIFNELQLAIAVLKEANPDEAFPGADPLYENNLAQWVRFANSLRLRMAMRVRFVEPTLAKTIVNECLKEPLIVENADNAKRLYEENDRAEFYNPLNHMLRVYYTVKVSDKLVETLKIKNDPRLTIFIRPNDDGEFIGLPNGLSDEALPNWNMDKMCIPTDTLVGKGATAYMLTASEVCFLRAEAALFNLSDENPDAWYQKGIEQALKQWEVNPELIETYLSGSEASLSGSQKEQFEQIATQMWIAFLPDAFEGWTNIRRTGYPVIEQRKAPTYDLGVTNGVLPKRFRYAANETNLNNSNYQAAIKLQGPDEVTTPLWWDIKD